MTVEIPSYVAEWLDTHRIPLNPEPADRGFQIWAEWDAHRNQVELGWWLEQVCPQCEEPERTTAPLVIPLGFGGYDNLHGCGAWWAPTRITAKLGVTEDDDLGELDHAFVYLRRARDIAEATLRERLEEDLRGFLADYTDDEDRAIAASGSEIQPGIWRNGDQWEAWDFTPGDADETNTTSVTEADLR